MGRSKRRSISSSIIHLYLSSNEPWNATYANEEGRAIYKTSSPWKMPGRKISVQKIIPNESEEDGSPRPILALAEVENKKITPSRIKYGGEGLLTSEYFRKSGGSEFFDLMTT
ncbi:hypothetical protein K443DRAFT_511354 [Laccaria amethystina LaAM-08-1]|uniref:Uncharacterized protein n=1 Tax=Laccaria amethystina LaAM-08-1 TaxID=1095629 RepID=A0A0C9XY73_9AGAR|nr:hypothetical protein K443DRAFT_511354 [Laccaria amethystina LaAM-08-1]